MMLLRWPLRALSTLVLTLVPCACSAQGYTFGPGNYYPPAGSGTQVTGIIQGNQTQVTGSPVNAALKFPSSSLQQYAGITFAGNTGCSPHAPKDYLAVRTFLVPALETEGPAIRTWRAQGDSGSVASVTYLDLVSGNMVLAAPQFSFSQQVQSFNYTLLTPNLVDLAEYQAALGQLLQVTQGLVTGQPPWQASGSPCNQPIPALQCVLEYLQGVKAQVGSPAAGGAGQLRPTEVQLPSGCVEEVDANYKGDLLSGVIASQQSGDACCQRCKAQSKCNVWVWCPLTSGCSTGNGTFPYLGCQLKYQAGLSTSASSTAQPDAWERGPPTSFVSGKVTSS